MTHEIITFYRIIMLRKCCQKDARMHFSKFKRLQGLVPDEMKFSFAAVLFASVLQAIRPTSERP